MVMQLEIPDHLKEKLVERAGANRMTVEAVIVACIEAQLGRKGWEYHGDCNGCGAPIYMPAEG